MALAIKNLTRRASCVAGLPFLKVAKEMAPSYDISLAFVTPAKARALNKQLRNKDYIPNVLSYALGAKSGEILICLAEAQKQAPAYAMTERDFILYLFIHGLLHVKGGVHGATMERSERKLLAKFAKNGARSLLNVTTHSNRNRHRHVPSKDGRRRGAR